jgi:hypothetical protein
MHANQVQVRVWVRAFGVPQRRSTLQPPGQPLRRARQEQWLRAREERCARRADQVRSINRLTGVGVEVPSSKKNIAHGVCASGQPHAQRPPNDNGPHYFRCKRPQKRPKEQGRFVWR